MKLYIYVTDVDQALSGEFEWSLSVSTISNISSWMLVGEIDVELDLQRQELVDSALQSLTAKELELLAQLELIKQKKGEYLALPHLEETNANH